MKRLTSFIFGMPVGAGLLYATLHFHLIHADDGLHLIPKLSPELKSTYVDIREFTVHDWAAYPDLAAALMKSDQGNLVEGAATDALNNGLKRILGGGNPQ